MVRCPGSYRAIMLAGTKPGCSATCRLQLIIASKKHIFNQPVNGLARFRNCIVYPGGTEVDSVDSRTLQLESRTNNIIRSVGQPSQGDIGSRLPSVPIAVERWLAPIRNPGLRDCAFGRNRAPLPILSSGQGARRRLPQGTKHHWPPVQGLFQSKPLVQ